MTWRTILASVGDDIARHPGWWSLVVYAGALFAYDAAREHRRVRAMVEDVTADMIARADEIEERMTRAIAEEHET